MTPHDTVLAAIFASAAATFVALFFVTAPYGRHGRDGWGPRMPTRAAWVVMESPAVLAFAGFYFDGPRALELAPLALLALWMTHYVQRTFVFPFLIRPRAGGTPIAIAAMAFVFNVANAYVNATWIASDEAGYATGWLTDPRFLGGAALFLVGFGINRWADRVLRNLRRDGSREYRIPRGGLYELVSCPNYAGEMLEWCGWALACWSLAGVSFAVFTVANLLPRAISHHRWYRETFPDYPARRKAAIPFLL